MDNNEGRAAMISVEMNALRDYTRSEPDLITTLDRLHTLGVTGVQLRLLPYIDDRRLAYELAVRGLYADSVFVALEDIVSYPAGAASLAETFGIDMIRTDGMPAEYSRSEESIKSYAERLEKAAAALESRNMRLIYRLGAIEFTQLYDQVAGSSRCAVDLLLENTEKLLFMPDLYRMTAAGYPPVTALEKFAGRAPYVIAQGCGLLPGSQTLSPMPAGTGCLDWEKVIKAVDGIGAYNYIIACDRPVTSPIGDITVGLSNMTKLLSSLRRSEDSPAE
ncbi:MAG: sugar phosphate isomerase/epimerase [Clostridiales bacterium]|nr:sugar phosphate isomerase/epimerase [Clostridiales bacterium]